MSANDAGIIAAIILIGSSLIFTIPVFATRGMTQVLWLGAVGLALTVELAALVTFVVLVSQGEINPNF